LQKKKIFGFIVATVIGLQGIQPSWAIEEPQALEVLARIAPQVLDGNVTEVGIAKRSARSLATKPGTLFSSESRGLRLGLSQPDLEKSTEFRGANYRTLKSSDGTEFIPLLKFDGSVQTLAILRSPDAQKYLEFDLELPTNAKAELLESGEVVITDLQGKFLAGISAPWAKDSNGEAVETFFELKAGKLIQHVLHSSKNYTYPIVADPWFGIDLYNKPTVTFHSKGYRINVTPTAWGTANTGIATWFAHRDEVKTKLGTNAWRWTNTIQEQFYCHIAGVPFSLPEYNMESWQPLVNWATSLTAYLCNPDKGTWY
jgi:hypothetical protein